MNLAAQSGIIEEIYSQGVEREGNPTTLVLDSYSANLYTTDNNTDPTAKQITTTECAAGTAIGEDNPVAGVSGVGNDGTNSEMVLSYGVLGGSCDTAGGVDASFHFPSASLSFTVIKSTAAAAAGRFRIASAFRPPRVESMNLLMMKLRFPFRELEWKLIVQKCTVVRKPSRFILTCIYYHVYILARPTLLPVFKEIQGCSPPRQGSVCT